MKGGESEVNPSESFPPLFPPQGVCLARPRAARGHPHAAASLPLRPGQRRRLPAAPVLRGQPGQGGGKVDGTRWAVGVKINEVDVTVMSHSSGGGKSCHV